MEAIEQLRTVIADESLSITARREAATRLIELTVAAVPDAAEDDAEVLKLRTPCEDEGLAALSAHATQGRSLTGWSLTDAKAEVKDRNRFRALLALVIDESLPRVARLVAVETVMSQLHSRNFYRVNNYTPEKMLDSIRTVGEGKYRGKAERPPRQFSDLWSV